MTVRKFRESILIKDGNDIIIVIEPYYDQFVTELEQLARELWPDKFKPRTLKDWADEFKGEVKDDK